MRGCVQNRLWHRIPYSGMLARWGIQHGWSLNCAMYEFLRVVPATQGRCKIYTSFHLFVLRGSLENIFNSSEVAVPDAMSFSSDLALPFLLLFQKHFDVKMSVFLHVFCYRGFINSFPPLTLSGLKVLLVEDRKVCVVRFGISKVFVLEDISLVPGCDSYSLMV